MTLRDQIESIWRKYAKMVGYLTIPVEWQWLKQGDCNNRMFDALVTRIEELERRIIVLGGQRKGK